MGGGLTSVSFRSDEIYNRRSQRCLLLFILWRLVEWSLKTDLIPQTSFCISCRANYRSKSKIKDSLEVLLTFYLQLGCF